MSRTLAVKKSADLQAEIRATTVAPGQAAIWWLGQATFAIKLGTTLIYTDPFYRDAGEEPPTLTELPLRPNEFTDADLICCTHEHLDHIDPKTLPGAAAASPRAKVIIPAATRDFVESLTVPPNRIQTMRGDDIARFGNVTIHAVPAAHMSLDFTTARGHRYLGYVIQGNGVTLYHSGDTQPYHGWSKRISTFQLDVALLPISGVDNLHWPQAVYFCADHRPRLAIPMHYGLFAGYTEDPQKFAKALENNVPEQKVRVMRVGERVIYDVKEYA